jgi:hypothetical protein
MVLPESIVFSFDVRDIQADTWQWAVTLLARYLYYFTHSICLRVTLLGLPKLAPCSNLVLLVIKHTKWILLLLLALEPYYRITLDGDF